MDIQSVSRKIAREVTEYIYRTDSSYEKDVETLSSIIQNELEIALEEQEEDDLALTSEPSFMEHDEYFECHPEGMGTSEGQGEYE